MLMMFLTILFSILSTGIMGYLAMSADLGPWFAPIFVVVGMIFLMPLFNARWFLRHIIVVIVSSSIGGMIGICLGYSFPLFFLMHHHLFEYWMLHPVKMAVIIFCFVITAGLYAFLIGYVLRNYFLVQTHLKFPMSQLVHDIVYIDESKQSRSLMYIGIIVSFCWNIISWFGRFFIVVHSARINMLPVLASIGFVAGQGMAISIFIGFVTRVIVMRFLNIYLPTNLTENAFLITFCLGIICGWFLINTIFLYTKKPMSYWQHASFVLKMSRKKWFFMWYLIIAALAFIWFTYWQTAIMAMLLTFLVILWLGRYMVDIIAQIGIIEINTYVWFILLGAIYFIPITSLSIVAIAVFSMLCLGMVINLMFSYKLADLSELSYKFIIKYQVVATICAALSSGFLFWYMFNNFDIGSSHLSIAKAVELEGIIRLGQYDFKVFLMGFCYGTILTYFLHEVLTIVGGVLMDPFFAGILAFSGAFSNVIKKRERFYPVCLGIYAGHMLWMLFGMFK